MKFKDLFFTKKPVPLPKLYLHSLQMTYAFHKFIKGYRGTEDWNKLDEEAYQTALKGE